MLKVQKIFGPGKFPIQIIGYKNNFGPKYFESKQFWSNKILGLKNLGKKKWIPKIMDQKKIWANKFILDHTIAGQKNWGQKNFGSKKILNPKNVGPKSF